MGPLGLFILMCISTFIHKVDLAFFKSFMTDMCPIFDLYSECILYINLYEWTEYYKYMYVTMGHFIEIYLLLLSGA